VKFFKRKTKLEKSLAVFEKSLQEHSDYFETWKANIAMSFVDAVDNYKRKTKKKRLSRVDIHTCANKAAENFLWMFIKTSKNYKGDK